MNVKINDVKIKFVCVRACVYFIFPSNYVSSVVNIIRKII